MPLPLSAALPFAASTGGLQLQPTRLVHQAASECTVPAAYFLLAFINTLFGLLWWGVIVLFNFYDVDSCDSPDPPRQCTDFKAAFIAGITLAVLILLHAFYKLGKLIAITNKALTKFGVKLKAAGRPTTPKTPTHMYMYMSSQPICLVAAGPYKADGTNAVDELVSTWFLDMTHEQMWVQVDSYMSLNRAASNPDGFKDFLMIKHGTQGVRALSYSCSKLADKLFEERVAQRLNAEHQTFVQKLGSGTRVGPTTPPLPAPRFADPHTWLQHLA